MLEEKYSYQPLFIVLVTLSLLGIIGHISKKYFSHMNLRHVDLIGDIRPTATPTPRMVTIATSLSKSGKTQGTTTIKDTLINLEFLPHLQGDSVSGMTTFNQAIVKLSQGKKKVRIAYFGDSVIEGDLITENLRRVLQKKYGGKGVGYMPITSVVANFRKTIIHKFSPEWHTVSLINPHDKGSDCGISGYGFFAPADSLDADSTIRKYLWAKYWGVKNSRRLHQFEVVKLFYGSPQTHPSHAIFFDGKNNIPFLLSGKNVVNEKILASNTSLNTFQIGVSSRFKQNIYGVSIESDSGIFIDNFSLRGNSGMPLSKLSVDMLQSFNQYMNYDLIILHYGLNVLSSELKFFNWYENGMNRVIQNFKKAFPHTSILLVGISDKSSKVDGTFITEPNLKNLLEAQYHIAKNNNIGFYNLYVGMGGENSMVKWVEGDTALANKDYTHFNYRGAEKIAMLLHDWLNTNHKVHER